VLFGGGAARLPGSGAGGRLDNACQGDGDCQGKTIFILTLSNNMILEGPQMLPPIMGIKLYYWLFFVNKYF
jgi:hypothetical protein